MQKGSNVFIPNPYASKLLHHFSFSCYLNLQCFNVINIRKWSSLDEDEDDKITVDQKMAL